MKKKKQIPVKVDKAEVQIKDFFEFPEQYRFPLSQGGPASASSTSQN